MGRVWVRWDWYSLAKLFFEEDLRDLIGIHCLESDHLLPVNKKVTSRRI